VFEHIEPDESRHSACARLGAKPNVKAERESGDALPLGEARHTEAVEARCSGRVAAKVRGHGFPSPGVNPMHVVRWGAATPANRTLSMS